MLRRAVLALAAAPVVSVAQPGREPPHARIDPAWLHSQVGESIGPPGGDLQSLASVPGYPDRLYAGSANGHLLVSDDGAQSWREGRVDLADDAVFHHLETHPHTPDLAWAAYWRSSGGGGLLHSRDGGRSWQPVPVPGAPALRAVAVSPSQPAHMYAGGPGGAWCSVDGGQSWAEAGAGTPPLKEIESLAVDPRDPQRIYAGTWRQAYLSSDGGARWQRIGRGMEIDRDVFTIQICPELPDLMLAGTCGFLYQSSDGGALWSVRKAGLPFDHRRVHALAFDPRDRNRVWAGTRGGLYHSQDGAQSFRTVQTGVTVSAIATGGEPDRVCVATEEVGVLCSRAGAPFEEANRGLHATRVAAFDTMPDDFRGLFAVREEAARRQSLHISNDGGRNWTRITRGPTLAGVRFVRAVSGPVPQLLLADDRGRWFRLRSGKPLEAIAGPPGSQAAPAAVAVLADSGRVLVAAGDGLFAAAVEDLVAVPERDSGARARPAPLAPPYPAWKRLAEGAFGALAVSGGRFVARNLGDPGGILLGRIAAAGESELERVPGHGLPREVVALRLGPLSDPQVLYAITATAFYVSEDGGHRFTRRELPWPPGELVALAADPADPEQVVVLDARGELLRGRGRGRHWRVRDGDPRLRRAFDFRLSAASPGLALVATRGHGVRVVGVAGSAPSREALE